MKTSGYVIASSAEPSTFSLSRLFSYLPVMVLPRLSSFFCLFSSRHRDNCSLSASLLIFRQINARVLLSRSRLITHLAGGFRREITALSRRPKLTFFICNKHFRVSGVGVLLRIAEKAKTSAKIMTRKKNFSRPLPLPALPLVVVCKRHLA